MSTNGTFARRAINFYLNLREPTSLPDSVQVMNPYQSEVVLAGVEQFYRKFFDDYATRTFVLGINPGRFGGGITGISFTSPAALRQYCGIQHPFPDTHELSSKFVYACINAYGGAAAFYRKFYLSALYPLALVRHGKNYNFYDSPGLYAHLKPAIVESLQTQFTFGANEKRVICLGKKNGAYLKRLNDELPLFREITVLEHPRYIMQYQSKRMAHYVDLYLEALGASSQNK